MAKDKLTSEDFDLLNQLEVDTTPDVQRKLTAEEERVIAGFEDITRFVEREGRVPQHGPDLDIFERMYAVRLDRLRELSQFHELLAPYDEQGILSVSASAKTSPEPETDEELLEALGVDLIEDDLTELKHVRSYSERSSPEEVAQRKPCEDFEMFEPRFSEAKKGLELGTWTTTKYKDDATIEVGHLFILDGQMVLVVDEGEEFKQEHGRIDRRLRVVYDNKMESNPLRRSLQRVLNMDKVSRRVRKLDAGPLFASVENADTIVNGRLYVLRSLSEEPFIAERRDLIHKIGVTRGDISTRIANAKNDSTYLLADVEVVASYKLGNIDPVRFERLILKFFAEANLEIQIRDRFDRTVQPREWFLVPLKAIEAAMDKIQEGTIGEYYYNVEKARVELR